MYTFVKTSQNWILRRTNFFVCKLYFNTNGRKNGSVGTISLFWGCGSNLPALFAPGKITWVVLQLRDYPLSLSSPLRELLIKGMPMVHCVSWRDHLSLSLEQLWRGRRVGLNRLDALSWDFESWEYVTKGLRLVAGEFHCANSRGTWTDICAKTLTLFLLLSRVSLLLPPYPSNSCFAYNDKSWFLLGAPG